MCFVEFRNNLVQVGTLVCFVFNLFDSEVEVGANDDNGIVVAVC